MHRLVAGNYTPVDKYKTELKLKRKLKSEKEIKTETYK